ncbi:MAG: hypothetical protein Q8N77_04835 [Nanoarchaeota archaeon]|nr:hypothetical protein [Nanoarchaeota archaeon]
MYKEEFIKSCKDLKNNLILFLPDLAMLILNFIFGLLFLKYSGFLSIVSDPWTLTKEVETMAPAIKLFLRENLLRIAITLLMFILTSFLIGAGLTAMKLGMMNSLRNNQKPTFRSMISSGRYVWQVVSMKMIMFVIGTVFFLFSIGTFLILSTLMPKVYVWITVGFLFPTLLVALQLILFFRYQVMFLENKHAITAVKESYYYFLKNKKHVFLTWMIVTMVSLVTAPLAAYMGFAEQKGIVITAAVIIGYSLRSIINLLINVWSDMFRFRSYKSQI